MAQPEALASGATASTMEKTETETLVYVLQMVTVEGDDVPVQETATMEPQDANL